MALYVKFDCATCENKNCTGHGLPTTEKVCDAYKHTVTNADRIRAMSDEELAVQLAFPLMATPLWCSEHDPCPYMNEDHDAVPCDKCALDWLKQEADGGAE